MSVSDQFVRSQFHIARIKFINIFHKYLIILGAVFVAAEKFFDMSQQQCKDALEIYKKFIARMERVRAFLRVAEVNKCVLIVLLFCFILIQCRLHISNRNELYGTL